MDSYLTNILLIISIIIYIVIYHKRKRKKSIETLDQEDVKRIREMPYYCFLCNDYHNDSLTEEHFIPRSIDGPERQWLPVCEASNTQSNSVFDNDARDILYLVRFHDTRALKRSGEALLDDGTLRPFKFSYYEDVELEESTAFQYIHDRETNTHIPLENVYAISFPVGLNSDEQETLCRGLVKISLGALVYLLKEEGMEETTIQKMFLQTSIDAIRHFALDLPWNGERIEIRFSLGASDVLEQLQSSCENQQVRNHVLKIIFNDDHSIHIRGMLYSQYGWMLNISNQIVSEERELRLENPITHMNAPESLRDLSLSPDRICIINPDFIGQQPTIPDHWENS